MSKEAPWHSKTMALPCASLVGGDERVYHDNERVPWGSGFRQSDGTTVRGRT